MSLADAFRRNTLWVLSGDLGARVVQLAFGVVLARLLMPEDFGLLVTVQVLTGALGFLSAHGMGDALVRAKAVGPRDIATVFAVQLGVSLLIVAALNLVAPAFAALFAEPRLDPLLRLSSLTFLLRPFMGVPSALLQREMRFKVLSLLIPVDFLVSGVASVALAVAGLGAASLVWGGLAGGAVRTLLLARAAGWVPALAFERTAARSLGLYGLKLSANEILLYARVQSANALIARHLGMTGVGLYNKADSLAEIPFELFGGAAYYTLFRTLASLRDEPGRGAQLYMQTLATVVFYTLPLYVGLAWVAEPAIALVYGAQWTGAALPLQILAAGGVFRAVSCLARSVAAAHNRLGREMGIQLESWAILLLGVGAGLYLGGDLGLGAVALGMLPCFVHNALRMQGLAGAILGIRWGDLGLALGPIVALNAVLALALGGAHLALVGTGILEPGPVYLAIMVAAAALAYGLPFLLWPPPGLEDEAARWRRLLGDRTAAGP